MEITNLDEEDGPPVASGLLLSSFEIPAAGVALALAAPRYFRSFLKYFSKALRKIENWLLYCPHVSRVAVPDHYAL